jgi:hypothetical protein
MMTELPIVIDNFFEEDYQQKIEDSMFDCIWKVTMDNTRSIDAQSTQDKYRKFLDPFKYDISPSITTNLLNSVNGTFELFYPVVEKVCNHMDFSIEKISRCIAGIQGVQVLREQNKLCGIHINQQTPHLVLLYYVNDSDGDTLLFNKTTNDVEGCPLYYDHNECDFDIDYRVTPKQGRVLLFDGRTYHSSCSPTEGIRCIITLDIFGKFNDKSYKFPAPKNYLYT